MDREAVESKVFASVGYEPESEVLELEFSSGRIYRYMGVSAETHAWFMRSAEKGGFFNRMIDGKFEFERIDYIDPNAPSLEDALRASLRPPPEETNEPEG